MEIVKSSKNIEILNQNIKDDFFVVPNLKFDVEKLRADFNLILKKKKFNTLGITNFGAIALNQIPGDKSSIEGHNVRGTYWTIPDEEGKEIAVAGSLSHMLPLIPGTDVVDKKLVPSEMAMSDGFHELAEILKESGVDLILLEMMYNPVRIPLVLEAALSTGLPVWFGLTVRRSESNQVISFDKHEDISLEKVIQLIPDQGVDVVGVMHSPSDIISEAIREIRKYFSGPLSVYPDSGYFESPEWNFNDIITPERLQEFFSEWLEEEATILGGCCGLGLDHIAKIQSDNSLNISLKKFKILHISSCFPRKGIDILLKAYAKVFNKNDDVSLAQAIVSVPINPDFSSLNLAQCVILLAYEWFNLHLMPEVRSQDQKDIQYASLLEVEHLRSAFLKNLDVANYFWPEDKRVSLMENLTNLLGRLPLTSADVRTLHGIIKSLVKR